MSHETVLLILNLVFKLLVIKALRIVLASVDSVASRHKKLIVPILSCSIDFYVRLFIRVFNSPSESKKSSKYCLTISALISILGGNPTYFVV